MENNNNSILVVDDDLGILDSMKDVLESEGYLVETINNGYDAVKLARSHIYKLAIVDIKMPGMGGIGVLKAIHEIDPTLPVIIFTGCATIETATEAIRLGAYDYITKPFEWERFLNIIKKAIERRNLLLNNKSLFEDLAKANENLKDKVKQLYKLNEVGNVMNSMLDIENLLGYILNVSCQLLNAKKGSILLFDSTQYNLLVKVTKGIDFNSVKDIVFKKDEGFIGNLVKKGKVYFDLFSDRKDNFCKKDELLDVNAKDFLSFPLRIKGKIFGLLNLSRFKENSDAETNIQIGSILSSQAATAIDNARLYLNMQNSYLNVMEILINAMESKSKYTRGHSERVANFCRQFCLDLNLPSDQIEHMKQASRLHDIGKMTISDFILNKQDKLTSEEWQEIRLHPERGSDTLKPLGFLNGISPVIRAHHERFDGKGYPDGLQGKNVPEGSRIISIIDSFDAMVSERPYRRAYNIEEVIKEIKINSGLQFDPDFTDIFLKITLPKIKKTL